MVVWTWKWQKMWTSTSFKCFFYLDVDYKNEFSSAIFGWMHALCQMFNYVLPHKTFITFAKACDIIRVLSHKFKILVKSCFVSRNIPFQNIQVQACN